MWHYSHLSWLFWSIVVVHVQRTWSKYWQMKNLKICFHWLLCSTLKYHVGKHHYLHSLPGNAAAMLSLNRCETTAGSHAWYSTLKLLQSLEKLQLSISHGNEMQVKEVTVNWESLTDDNTFWGLPLEMVAETKVICMVILVFSPLLYVKVCYIDLAKLIGTSSQLHMSEDKDEG